MPIVVNITKVMPDGTAVIRGWLMAEAHYDAMVKICEKYGLPAGEALVENGSIRDAAESFRQHVIDLEP